MPSEVNSDEGLRRVTGKGARLKQLRDNLALTQEEMALQFEVTARSYRRWEREASPWPVSLIEDLYDKYQVDPTWLLYGTKPDIAARDAVAVKLLTAIDNVLVKLGMDRGTEGLRRLLFQDFLCAIEGRDVPDESALEHSIQSVGRAYKQNRGAET